MAISIVNLMLAAKYFGVTLERDVWILALNCVIVVDMAIWGPINETFRAKFVLLKEQKGERESLLHTRSLIYLTLLTSLVIVSAIMFGSAQIAAVLAPNFSIEEREALSLMVMVLAPSLLFNQATQLAIGVLNAYESFYIPEIASSIASAFNVIVMVLLASVVGIYSLVIGYYFGLLLLVILLAKQFVKRRIMLFDKLDGVELKKALPFILFSVPFFLPYIFAQLNLVIEKSLASTMGVGIVSSLDYARKMPDVFLTVLTSVLTTMLVPVLSSFFARGNLHEAYSDFRKMFQLGMLLVTLLICIVFSSSIEIIHVLYNQGRISAETLSMISRLSIYYSWASLPVFLYLIAGVTLLAQNRGKLYAAFGLLAQLGMIAINFAFFNRVGPFVFPLALFISHSIAALLLFSNLPFNKQDLLKTFFKYLLILTIAYGVSWLLVDLNFTLPFFQFILKSILIVGFILFLLFLLRTEEGRLLQVYTRKLYMKVKGNNQN